MYSQELLKPDGRKLTLYPVPNCRGYPAPSPGNEPLGANPHLRWHPLRGEWVATLVTVRGTIPPPEYNPLAPPKTLSFRRNFPQGRYDVAVFDNRFPSLTLAAHDPPQCIVDTLPNGACEVSLSQDPYASLGSLELDHLDLLLQVWADRTRVVAEIRFSMCYRSRSLYHPHGQIYAYPLCRPSQHACGSASRLITE